MGGRRPATRLYLSYDVQRILAPLEDGGREGTCGRRGGNISLHGGPVPF